MERMRLVRPADLKRGDIIASKLPITATDVSFYVFDMDDVSSPKDNELFVIEVETGRRTNIQWNMFIEDRCSEEYVVDEEEIKLINLTR